MCYDDPDNKEDIWDHRQRLSKKAPTRPQMLLRCEWGGMMQAKEHRPCYWYKNVAWTDICNSILPRSAQRNQEMVLSRKAKKGWASEATRLESRHFCGTPENLKQNSWDSIRVYWAPVLSQGKVHLVYLGDDFPGKKPEGAAKLVAKVRTVLNLRFQGNNPPTILFTDRGQGFYDERTGNITAEYKAALAEHSLKAYYLKNASEQPGTLQEVMLHETVVAWVREREEKTQPKEPWKETREDFAIRLREINHYITANYSPNSLSYKGSYGVTFSSAHDPGPEPGTLPASRFLCILQYLVTLTFKNTS